MRAMILTTAMVLTCLAVVPAEAGTLAIKGSTTVLPIAQTIAEAFMRDYPEVKISLSGGGSGNGIKALVDGTTDIADSSRFIKEKEISLAVEKGRYPVPFAVAYDCIVPVVHPANQVRDLSPGQLKGIYQGRIKNWKEVGGADMKIVVISRDTSSGTYEVWGEKVMGKERVFPGALLQASNGAVAQIVSKTRGALGYVGIGYLNSDLKALSVNGVEGNPTTAQNGSFPVSRALFMFTAGWPSGDTLTFIGYALHPLKGQKLVATAGFVPLY